MPTNPVFATKDPLVLLARIEREFPQLSWSDYKFIDRGWDHEVIQLDNEYIFRFPNSREYLPLLRDEIRILQYLSKNTTARIPHYSYVAKDFSFGGYKMLSGTELTVEMFNRLHEGIKDIVAVDIANFLTELHSIALDELAQFNIGTEKPFGGYNEDDEHVEMDEQEEDD